MSTPPSEPEASSRSSTPPRRSWEGWIVIAALALAGAGLAKRFGGQIGRSTPAAQEVSTTPGRAERVTGPASATVSRSADTSMRGKMTPLVVRDVNHEPVVLYKQSFALVVGVSDYSHWPHLSGVAEDVEVVASQLAKLGFQVEKVLDPTGPMLEEQFRKFLNHRGFTRDTWDNRLLIYFAGHGHTIKSTGSAPDRVFLVGKEAPVLSLDSSREEEIAFAEASYPMTRFYQLADELQAKHALFVFDSCFSGGLAETARSSGLPEAISQAAAHPVRAFLTSGSPGQTVPDKSIFRDEFIRALQGEADTMQKDGFVTASEISQHITRFLKANPTCKQTPLFWKSSKANQGEFVFPLSMEAGSITQEDLEKIEHSQPVLLPDPKHGTTPRETVPETALADLETVVEVKSATVNLLFRRVLANSFDTDDARRHDIDGDKPKYESAKIEVTQNFFMAEQEVTQAMFSYVLRNAAAFRSGTQDDNMPAVNVSCADAEEFARLLTKMDRKAGLLPADWEYRLPWEAEYDLAAASGQNVIRRDELRAVAFDEELGGKNVRSVKRERSNLGGFFDLYGNVHEWCGDRFVAGLPQDEMNDPRGSYDGEYRVVRGGVRQEGMRQVSLRYMGYDERSKSPHVGFRIVLARVDPSAPERDVVIPDGSSDTRIFSISQLFSESEYKTFKAAAQQEIARRVQKSLVEVGFYRGAIDGEKSAAFQIAVNNFQWVNHLKLTGRLDPSTLRKLLLDGNSEEELLKLAGLAKAASDQGGRTGASRSSNGGSGSSSNSSDGEPDWIRKSGIKYWAPIAMRWGPPGR